MKKNLAALLILFIVGVHPIKAQSPSTDTVTSTLEAKHHFLVNLPGQISFKVSLIALDDWDGNNFSAIVTKQVKKHVGYFEDSMNSNPTLQNILYVEKSTTADFEKLNFRQVSPATTDIVFKDGSYYNLKNSMDSLFYTSYIANQQAKQGAADSLHQRLMTITAKSLSDLGSLSITQIQKVRQQMDSMVQAAKLKANRYNPNLYSSNSRWSLSPAGTQTTSFTDQKPFRKVVNNFKLGVSYGAIVFNNSIAPLMELNLGYILKRSGQHATFVGLNYSLFTELDLKNRDNNIGYFPLTLEVGTIRNHIGLMQRKTSIGYGMLLKTTQESGVVTNHYLFNMQLNFSFSNTLSSSFIIASQFKKDPEHYVLGVSLKYNL
ncbi:MAG: hypothetical protein EOP54_12305 [Sphingobacteriales bacterium]|nr:MAG: hypothetical protein EOP54_12305 [Sphingobacteriales bacterium]